MSKDLSNKKRGTPSNPSEGGAGSGNPQTPPSHRNTEPKEGDYRNIETSVNNPSYFDDDYEVEQENKIAEDEAKREREDRIKRSKK